MKFIEVVDDKNVLVEMTLGEIFLIKDLAFSITDESIKEKIKDQMNELIREIMSFRNGVNNG